MPWWIPVALGASALGGLLSGRKKTQTQTSTSTTTPNEQQEYLPLRDTLIAQALQRLQSPTALPPGYAAGGITNINRTADIGQNALRGRLAGAGLLGSPIEAGGIQNLEMGRLGNIVNFQNQLPLIERDLQQEDLRNAMALFASRPIGSTTTGQGTSTTPGNMLGGAFSGVGSMLGFLLGSGAMGGASGGAGATGGGAASALSRNFPIAQMGPLHQSPTTGGLDWKALQALLPFLTRGGV